jgi:hypothetical protein
MSGTTKLGGEVFQLSKHPGQSANHDRGIMHLVGHDVWHSGLRRLAHCPVLRLILCMAQWTTTFGLRLNDYGSPIVILCLSDDGRAGMFGGLGADGLRVRLEDGRVAAMKTTAHRETGSTASMACVLLAGIGGWMGSATALLIPGRFAAGFTTPL